MSTAGKILAIVNIFAAIGVVALLGMDYSKRRSWQYAVFRNDLMINGLPLDENQRDEMGRPLVDNISEPTVKELFPSNPPAKPTQRAEVERVQGQLRGKIDAAADKKQKCYLLARLLMPFAVAYDQQQRLMACQTYLRDNQAFARLQNLLAAADRQARQPQPKNGQRAKPYEELFDEALEAQHAIPAGALAEEFRTAMKANPATPPAQALDQAIEAQLTQLQGQFEQLFRDALEPTPTAVSEQGRPRSLLKHNIARLLFNTLDALAEEQPGAAPNLNVSENPAYKRFVLVVGVPAAAEAVSEQAQTLDAIAAEIREERVRRRVRFAHEHHQAVALVQAKRLEVEDHQREAKRQNDEKNAHEDSLKKRRRDVESYKEELAAARKKTEEQLQILRKMSDALYAQRLKLRDAAGKNLQLEKQIRALEEGR